MHDERKGRIDTVRYCYLLVRSKAKRLSAIWLRRSIHLILERTKESSISSALDGIHVER